jgi:hypothetical protein
LWIVLGGDLAKDRIKPVEVVSSALGSDVFAGLMFLSQEVGIDVSELNEVRVKRVPVVGIFHQGGDGNLAGGESVHPGNGVEPTHPTKKQAKRDFCRLIDNQQAEVLRVLRPWEVAIRQRVVEPLKQPLPRSAEHVKPWLMDGLVDYHVDYVDVRDCRLEFENIA